MRYTLACDLAGHFGSVSPTHVFASLVNPEGETSTRAPSSCRPAMICSASVLR